MAGETIGGRFDRSAKNGRGRIVRVFSRRLRPVVPARMHPCAHAPTCHTPASHVERERGRKEHDAQPNLLISLSDHYLR
eukprot:7146576-Alexandrium_andersonii.AAC.1